MDTILIQKHPIKGYREFKLVDDEVQYVIKSPLKKAELSVVLNVLDPEPVISGSMLSFVSQVNREPLVEFFLNRPDKETFEKFIQVMQARIVEEDFGRFCVSEQGVKVEIERLNESIEMLQKYVDQKEIASLMTALLQLKAKPDDIGVLNSLAEEFNGLGFVQGQVMTYAPYINYLLSKDRDARGPVRF